MTVWCVWQAEYDGDWIVAAYTTEALAIEHASRERRFRMEPLEIFDTLQENP